MSEANIFERIVEPEDIEAAIAATLDLWIDDYLGEMERKKGYAANEIARPAGIITASEFAKWDEDQLPLIMIVSPGLAGAPIRRKGGGSYEAEWSLTVAAIVADVDEQQTRRLMSAYAGAIRAAILQHKALKSPLHPNGFASFLSWKDETYSDIPFPDTRALDSCRVIFNVGVEDVVTEQAGPREPYVNPAIDPGDNPTVTQVQVTTTPVRTLP